MEIKIKKIGKISFFSLKNLLKKRLPIVTQKSQNPKIKAEKNSFPKKTLTNSLKSELCETTEKTPSKKKENFKRFCFINSILSKNFFWI